MTTSNSSQSVSRRTALAGLGAGSLGVVLATAARPALAQDATAEMANHPLVGTWIANIPGPPNPPGPLLISFAADGILTQLDPVRGNGMGVWEATGERTGVLTIVFVNYAPGSTTDFLGLAFARNVLEVDATGDAYTGQGEIEFRALDGTKIDGPYAVVAIDAKRVRMEPTFGLMVVATPAATPTT
jgi:hypothetical protein